MRKYLTILLLNACAIEHRHTGNVDVNVKLDYEELKALCAMELGVDGSDEYWEAFEWELVHSCISNRMAEIAEAIN